ncbi:hypothetical protein K505DRAFT_85205 [Melanomma pulvis-pyrius CBS 109.77]|uniref:Uncharacterized protein n=1 Tax=Melanomma pulvis-pyrius CBS 109.77 TaxID=1314802 RepID=A0A6A6XRW3_9PLEO|nr:hypothetical protein K505DRAFT_85205 [Melanomma pulvis-pyrius CBS 109.77]
MGTQQQQQQQLAPALSCARGAAPWPGLRPGAAGSRREAIEGGQLCAVATGLGGAVQRWPPRCAEIYESSGVRTRRPDSRREDRVQSRRQSELRNAKGRQGSTARKDEMAADGEGEGRGRAEGGGEAADAVEPRSAFNEATRRQCRPIRSCGHAGRGDDPASARGGGAGGG